MIDGIHAVHGAFDIVEVSQVADNGFYAIIIVKFVRAAGVGGVDETTDIVPLLQQPFGEIRANSSRPAGNQYLHYECSSRLQ